MKPNTWYRLSYDGELIEVSEADALAGRAFSFNTGKGDSPVEVDELT
jgi:hypothetical protein